MLVLTYGESKMLEGLFIIYVPLIAERQRIYNLRNFEALKKLLRFDSVSCIVLKHLAWIILSLEQHYKVGIVIRSKGQKLA